MIKKACLGGGCFWGMQELFREQPGVITTRVGYSGGSVINPTYESHAGHAEVLEVSYDDEKTTYTKILDFFFQMHDPTTINRQGNDIGSSYRSVIFYNDDKEKAAADDFVSLVNKSGNWASSVVTSIEPFNIFYPAEEYHQDYLQKNLGGYTCHFIRQFGSYLDKASK